MKFHFKIPPKNIKIYSIFVTFFILKIGFCLFLSIFPNRVSKVKKLNALIEITFNASFWSIEKDFDIFVKSSDFEKTPNGQQTNHELGKSIDDVESGIK